MMIACGPFCSGCSSLLRVEACHRCSRAQAATDTACFFDTLEKCAMQGCTHCEYGVVLCAIPAQQCLRPADVQRLAAACVRRYPRGILVFHISSRMCCLIRHGSAPALVELADAAAHMMAPPSLAYVVLGCGRGAHRCAYRACDCARCVCADRAYDQGKTRDILAFIPPAP